MTTYYLKAYYPQSGVYERFSGELNTLYDKVNATWEYPENFSYEISTDEIDDYNQCTLSDLKSWSK